MEKEFKVILNFLEKKNYNMIEILGITEKKIEGKSEKEICRIISTNIIKMPKVLNFEEISSLLDYFRRNKNNIDIPLVTELSKIVNGCDYKTLFVLNKRDKNDINSLKKKINLLHFFVTFILIDLSYVKSFLPFLLETINFLNNSDEKEFILLTLKDNPNLIKKFKEINKQLKIFISKFTELRETRPETIAPQYFGIVDEISGIINKSIDMEQDYDYDYSEEEKLFDRLYANLYENRDYYEINNKLVECKINCQNLEEKEERISRLEYQIQEIYNANENNKNNGFNEFRHIIMDNNEDVTIAILLINKKVYLCRFVVEI
jgi:hypothetical protein